MKHLVVIAAVAVHIYLICRIALDVNAFNVHGNFDLITQYIAPLLLIAVSVAFDIAIIFDALSEITPISVYDKLLFFLMAFLLIGATSLSRNGYFFRQAFYLYTNWSSAEQCASSNNKPCSYVWSVANSETFDKSRGHECFTIIYRATPSDKAMLINALERGWKINGPTTRREDGNEMDTYFERGDSPMFPPYRLSLICGINELN